MTSGTNTLLLLSRRVLASSASPAARAASLLPSNAGRLLSAAATTSPPPLPDSVKRVGESFQYPNEYPGQVYAFNWALNGDGVTPTKKSAFRITKPLDLRVAGLAEPKKSPLKVKAAKDVAEAGSDDLPFERFDEVTQTVKDALSSSDHLYCPEGHAPGTRVGVRVITNSPTLSPDLLAYLERAPRKDPPGSQPVTAYVFEGASFEEFAGYAIEIVEDEDEDGNSLGPRSVASVVVAGKKPSIARVAGGIELSVAGIAADEAEAEAEAEAADEGSK